MSNTRPNGDRTEHCLHCGQEVILGSLDTWRLALYNSRGIRTGTGHCRQSDDFLHNPIPDTTDMAALEAWLEETP